LARSFRLYGKKRGHRRSGSRIVGNLGEALFFAIFLLLGCVGTVIVLVTLFIPEWRANHVFLEHRCHVLEKRIASRDSEDGPVFRPELRIRYVVDGQTYVTWTYDIRGAYSAGQKDKQAILDDFAAGQEYPCWYDPLDPGIAVLSRGYSGWFWLAAAVPISFVIIGAGGLVFRLLTLGKSTERGSLITKRAARLDVFAPSDRVRPEYPHIPAAFDITNSPGTTLAYRLPPERSSVWSLFAWLGVCIVWNGLVALFAVLAIKSILAGSPDWFMTAFTVPFLLCGIGLVVYFVRQVLVATAIGPTLVEISAQPLSPAKKYEVFLSQSGRLKLKSLEILLVCEEETTYRHGTNTRTESRRVFQQSLCRRETFEVHRAAPFQIQCDLEIPAGAMHSFKASHNEVQWRLIVRGECDKRRSYERAFPLIVLPDANDKGKP
jgi:hypothetical protein